MADEEDEGRRRTRTTRRRMRRRGRRRRRMDLNLYLGLPRSRTLDLGSDLALSSVPLSPTTDEMEMTTNYLFLHSHHHRHHHAPYSPTDATFSPGPILSPTLDFPLPPADRNPHQENTTTYFPSPMIPVPGFSPVSSPDSIVPIEIDEPESPPRATYTGPFYVPPSPESPSRATATGPFYVPPSPESHPRATATGPFYVPQSPYYFPPRSWSYIPLDFEEPDESMSVRPFSRTYRQTLLDRSPAYAPTSPLNLSAYAPTSPLNLSPTYAPQSPPYLPPSPSYVHPLPTAEWLGREDESPSRWNRLQSPEFRFRRLIESSHRLRVRRFRSSIPYPPRDQLGFGRASSSGPEELMLDIMSSQRTLGRNGKHKVPAGSVTTESSEEGKEENNKSTANFECNICLDMAEDPVVTSCGHLFCWPCLYQWLHVHSDHKECPVCKGEVTESNITPIYGRGSSGASDGKKLLGEIGLKIPPRPCGNRHESLRQQFRPIRRRFTEGIATSWRHPVDVQIRNRNRFEAHGDPNVVLTGDHIALMNRVRASYTREVLNPGAEAEEIRMPRESTPVPQSIVPGVLTSGQIGFWRRRSRAGLTAEELLNTESGPEAEDIRMSRESTGVSLSSSTVPLFRDGISVRRRLSIYDYATADGVAPIAADMGRAVGSDDRYGASSSYLDAWRSERWNSWGNVASASAADQASASSTAAMIRGDVGRPDGSVQPNSTGFF